MEREDLLKRLEEMQEPQLKYLAMLNEAFLQSMEIIDRVRKLVNFYEEKSIEANPMGYGEPLNETNSISYWRIVQEIRQALDGEPND